MNGIIPLVMRNERFDQRFDGRAFTSAIEGRRIGEKYVRPIASGITEVLQKHQSNRISHRIGGPAAQVLRDLAVAADLVPELSLEDKRAFLITEFHAQMPEVTDRLLKLFGVRGKPLDLFTEIVNREDRLGLFAQARVHISQNVDTSR